MKDSVILGSGNSRYLKSVADFKTLYPTYDDFAAALVAGTLPVDFNGINSAGFQQIGDALNAENLLKITTAALYGLPDTAVPDEVFALLKTMVSNAQTSADGRAKIESFSYVGTGVFGGNNATNTLTFSFPPKIVCVLGWKHPSSAYKPVTNYDNFMIPTSIMSTSFSEGAGIGWQGNYGKISSDGKTIYWYSGTSADYQLNGRNYTYYGFAIG